MAVHGEEVEVYLSPRGHGDPVRVRRFCRGERQDVGCSQVEESSRYYRHQHVLCFLVAVRQIEAYSCAYKGGHCGTELRLNGSGLAKPLWIRIAKSANSCGTSCSSTARNVDHWCGARVRDV